MRYIEDLMALSQVIDRVKRIKRTGWIKSKVLHAESVADHLLHTVITALYLKKYIDLDLDWMKILILSAIHDLGEAYTGDIPYPLKTEGDRYRELEYLKEIIELIGIHDIIDDVEESESLEHYIYKFSELLATYTQGLIYLQRGFRDPYIHDILKNTLDRMRDISSKSDVEILKNIVSTLENHYNNMV
ncbi:MAG TPA: HD domain-containing protein [Thermoprotei archaeon]|nr:HD domain-containing protein [Thermoprotei archaeon]